MTDEELKQALQSEILNFEDKKLSEEQIITIAYEIGYKRIKPVGLELSGNKISLEAMKYITQAVSRCPSLVYLSLIGCGLDDNSIYLITKHLFNHPLLSLILMSNNIAEQGEIMLSNMLAHNKHILEFNAQSNLMNMSTSIDSLFNTKVSFSETAQKNTTLISFSIEANKIPARYTNDIYERVIENRKRFEEEIMPNREGLSQYIIPESLVQYLKSQLSNYSEVTLDSYPLIVIAEQQKKLKLIKEAGNKTKLEPVVFSPRTSTTLLRMTIEPTETTPNKLGFS